ncbi:MAG TPA: hypothetical protein VN089_17245 [Duganella sp.]|nr:hypothetical protein [Duganella sp.]
MRYIKESDWKHLRQLKPVLLDRYCRQILSEVERIASKHEEASHPRYLAMYRVVQDRDRELGGMFNDMRRSSAIEQIFLLRRNGVFTDDEFAGFSDDIKDVIARLENL